MAFCETASCKRVLNVSLQFGFVAGVRQMSTVSSRYGALPPKLPTTSTEQVRPFSYGEVSDSRFLEAPYLFLVLMWEAHLQ